MIQPVTGRMKVEAPIRINDTRSSAAAGGRWAQLDPVGLGRVQLIRTSRTGTHCDSTTGCQLPASKVVSVLVLAIVGRTRAQSAAEYQEGLKVDGWEVVVPEVVVAP